MSLPVNNVFAVVPAGGSGARFGSAIPKQFLRLTGQGDHSKSVLEATLLSLLNTDLIKLIVVVVAPDDRYVLGSLNDLLKQHSVKLLVLFEGGSTRRESVLAGCRYLQNHCGAQESDWFLVHDAARPGITYAQVNAFIADLLNSSVGGLMALPMTDTVKRELSDTAITASAEYSKTVRCTVDREGLWLAQTPQMFRAGLLVQALAALTSATDEASAIENLGLRPQLVMGSRLNFKITSAEDLQLMSSLLNSVAAQDASVKLENTPESEAVSEAVSSKFSPANFRIGQGYDSHALVPGRKLILGGVTIACERGLLGHSDADALLHAIIDALLGATGGGDIGRHFPDTEPQFEGADSGALLQKVYAKLRADGWVLGNVDATIIAQSPKLQNYMPAIVARVAQLLSCDINQINVKAKTNEKLGHLGRGEAIGVHAVACVFKKYGI